MQPQTADLSTFVRKLADEKGLTNLDPEVRAQVEKDLMDRVENRLNASILAHMPPNKLGEFEALIDKGDEKEIHEFTQVAIPGLSEILAQELLNFREIYING
jgi:hypothetical protein